MLASVTSNRTRRSTGPGTPRTTSGDVLAHRGSRLRPAHSACPARLRYRAERGSVVVRARPRGDVTDVLSCELSAENAMSPLVAGIANGSIGGQALEPCY